MTAPAVSPMGPHARPLPHPFYYGNGRLLDNPVFAWMLFILHCTSGFVLIEPAPFDVYAVIAMSLFLFCGMTLSAGVAPLLLLIVLFFASGFVSATQVGASKDPNFDPFFYITVTMFLALNSLFFAFVIAMAPLKAFNIIIRGYVIAGLTTALAAIGGYFHLLPNSETFLLYGRAKGTFEDPNVMAPFLVPPALYLFSRIIRANPLKRVPEIVILAILLCAIFLSFSRGGWGYTLMAMGLVVFLTFATADTIKTRMRVTILAIGGLFALAVLLTWVASIEEVRELLVERAQLTQSYDVGELGRFSRQLNAIFLLAENPLGLGPLTFGYMFGEDPHNIYLKAFSSYGWLAGISYLVLVGTTLIAGFRHCFRRTPWQDLFQVAYVSFLGLAVLGLIIDTDRWRHFWLVLGLVWGLMAAHSELVRKKKYPRESA